ncbi:MAG: Rieske 2Fe-2S domain-containing protein [Gammaproteobacteria bacterium]|nr:Rieske 2Fe-2S domain-containing protein [Gammaproteobacteria bacterium]
MMAGNAMRHVLCRLEDIENPGSMAMTVTTAGGLQDIFVVRREEQVYGYINSCPHTGGPLDWVPGQFLDLDREYIQCATHDALFGIADGICVAGPCAGDRLTTVPLVIEAGEVIFTGT